MITMLGLFIVVTYVEQRFIVLPNTAGKKELYGSNPCLFIAEEVIAPNELNPKVPNTFGATDLTNGRAI